MRSVLYSLISFVMSLFFIIIGVMCGLLLWSPEARTNFVQFILEDSLTIFLFGLSFFVMGLAMIIHTIINTKKRHYFIKSKNNSLYISEDVFQDYLNTYWMEQFPKHSIPNQIILKKNKAYITAELPFVPFNQQKALIQRIESDLSDIFSRLIGYRKEYVLSISFKNKTSS